MNRTDAPAYSRMPAGKEMYRRRGWTWVLAPRPFDVVSSSLYIGVVLTDLYFPCNCDFTGWHGILIVGAVLALLSLERLEYWFYGEETPARSAIFLLLARIILIGLVAQLDNFSFSPFLYLIPPFLATQYFGNRIGYLMAGFAWAAYVTRIWLYTPDWYTYRGIDNDLIVFTLGLIFAFTMAQTVIKEKNSRIRAEELLSELESSHRQLRSYAEQVAELATTRERNRLARDIHDTLGHYLTVINVQLEKALAFRQRNSQQADQAVSDAKRLASEALQDVRRSVSALRATQELFSFSSAIADLVEHVRSNSLSINVNVEGSEADFSKQALMALYRVAQEGLTNIQKHAQADTVQMEIVFMEHEASLSLSDNGCGFDPSLLRGLQSGRDGQYGLLGVQERLELVGGCLQVESYPGEGTHLYATVPKDLLTNHPTHKNSSFSPVQKDG